MVCSNTTTPIYSSDAMIVSYTLAPDRRMVTIVLQQAPTGRPVADEASGKGEGKGVFPSLPAVCCYRGVHELVHVDSAHGRVDRRRDVFVTR
jgi:hypothetical protein